MVGNFHLMETQLEKKAESIVLIDTHTHPSDQLTPFMRVVYLRKYRVHGGFAPGKRSYRTIHSGS